MLKRDRYRCTCGAKAGRVDHLIPKFEGGQDTMANLRAICLACDKAKSAREGRRAASKSSAIHGEGPRGRLSSRGIPLFQAYGGGVNE